MQEADDIFYATFPQAKQAHQRVRALEQLGNNDYFDCPAFCYDANGDSHPTTVKASYPPFSRVDLPPAVPQPYVHIPPSSPPNDQTMLVPKLHKHYDYVRCPFDEALIRARLYGTNHSPESFGRRHWAEQRYSRHDPARLVDRCRRPIQNVVSAHYPLFGA
jgi:hypothetical protein